jgi:hypothetical protein
VVFVSATVTAVPGRSSNVTCTRVRSTVTSTVNGIGSGLASSGKALRLRIKARLAERSHAIIDPAIARATSPCAERACVVVVIHFKAVHTDRRVTVFAATVRRARRAFALGRRRQVAATLRLRSPGRVGATAGMTSIVPGGGFALFDRVPCHIGNLSVRARKNNDGGPF